MSLLQFPLLHQNCVTLSDTFGEVFLHHTTTSDCVWLGGVFMWAPSGASWVLAIVFNGKFVVMRKLKWVYCKLSTQDYKS